MFLGVQGFGSTVTVDTGNGKPMSVEAKKADLWKRAGDLDSFGALSEVDKSVLHGSIEVGLLTRAESIILEKEKKLQNKKAKTPKRGVLDQIAAKIPHGYGFKEELIHGVPNWTLYAGAAIFGIAAFGSRKRSALRARA